jgi:hypothetical protein
MKKNKITFPHRHQTYGYEWLISVEASAYETPTNLSSLEVDIFQTTINSWVEVTSLVSREAWYRVIRVLTRYLPMGWYHCSTSGVNVWAKLSFVSRTLNRYQSLISISLVSVWEGNFVLFNSMLINVINILMHAFFHIRTVIIPRPISTLGLKPSGRYWSRGW